MNLLSNPEQLPRALHPEAKTGIAYFNRKLYFEAHEHFELAWMETSSLERDLYQGLLQIGIAYYQITRGNFRGALKMFQRGQRNLAHLPESMLAIDIQQFRIDARRAESHLRSLGPGQIEQFPFELFKSIPLNK